VKFRKIFELWGETGKYPSRNRETWEKHLIFSKKGNSYVLLQELKDVILLKMYSLLNYYFFWIWMKVISRRGLCYVCFSRGLRILQWSTDYQRLNGQQSDRNLMQKCPDILLTGEAKLGVNISGEIFIVSSTS
jgi:hypothetical protein